MATAMATAMAVRSGRRVRAQRVSAGPRQRAMGAARAADRIPRRSRSASAHVSRTSEPNRAGPGPRHGPDPRVPSLSPQLRAPGPCPTGRPGPGGRGLRA
jgi:hypothetical protein